MPVRTPGSMSTWGTDGQYCSEHQPDLVEHRRHRRQAGRAGEPLGVVADQPVDGERELVGGDLGLGANPPVLHHFCVVTRAGYQPDDGVGVADVDGEQHGAQFLQGSSWLCSDPTRECPSMPAAAPMSMAMLSSSLVRPSRAATSSRAAPSAGAWPSQTSRTSR